MKNKFKILLIMIGLILIPITTCNAKTIEFEGNGTNTDVATYDIVFDPEGEEISSITFKINKTNDDLEYVVTKESIVGGTCNSSLECTLTTATIKEKTKIATITVKNKTNDTQKTIISIVGDLIGNGSKEFSLKPNTSTSTTTTTKAKNTEAKLSSLTLSNGTMDKNFSEDVLIYNVTGIKDTVNAVNIEAKTDNNSNIKILCPNAECSVSGNRVNLQIGANQVLVIVTSEDGNKTKSYTLNIYRGDIESNSAYLSSLTIKEGTLSPKFDKLVNDYSIDITEDVDKLDINAVSEDPNATIEIKGNEKLVVGENKVTITVTSSDKENIQVYSITVNKEEVATEEKKPIKTEKVEKKKNNILLIVIISLIGLAIIVTVAIILFKKKKKKNNKNDKNNHTGGNEDTVDIEELLNTKEHENLSSIRNASNELMKDEPKQDIDEALDDLMKTKKLELGDLDL